MEDPFSLNADGTAKDPIAFQTALRKDEVKLAALQQDADLAAILLGDDIGKMQDLLKAAFQASGIHNHCTCILWQWLS